MNLDEAATLEYVQFNRRGVVMRVPIEKVIYFESNGNYVQVYLDDGSKGHLRTTVKLLHELYGEKVARIHTSYLVFTRELMHVYRDTNAKYWARMRSNGKMLPVGRTKFENVRRLFEFDGVARRG